MPQFRAQRHQGDVLYARDTIDTPKCPITGFRAPRSPMKIKTKPTKKSLTRFLYFSECGDAKRLQEIPLDPNGFSAAECFHAHETYGKLLPCREPVLLSKTLNGKEWHGLTVTICAEDYLNRLLFASEIKTNYPDWVQHDIFSRAKQLSKQKLGYIPIFVKTGNDFSTLLPPQPTQQDTQPIIPTQPIQQPQSPPAPTPTPSRFARFIKWVKAKITKMFHGVYIVE